MYMSEKNGQSKKNVYVKKNTEKNGQPQKTLKKGQENWSLEEMFNKKGLLLEQLKEIDESYLGGTSLYLIANSYYVKCIWLNVYVK